MPIVQVQVAEKADPVLGKKRGRIKDTNGLIYQIPPALLGLVKVGNSYSLDYKDDEYNGAKFRVIESLSSVGGLPIGAPPQAPSFPPQQRQYDQAQSRPLQQAMPDTKTEDISVLAIVKCQQLPVGDRAGIFHALKASALAWRDFKKWQKLGPQTVQEDLDDEIP